MTDPVCPKRIFLLAELVEATLTSDIEPKEASFEKRFIQILSYFTKKYPAKILYSLHEISFTSYWEISHLSHLDNLHWVWKTFANLEGVGMVEQVQKGHADYETIKHFWKGEHLTSPKTPALFSLKKEFNKIVEAYSDTLIRQFFSKAELGAILSRKKRWEQHHVAVKNQKQFFDRRKAMSIGDCMVCGKLIMKTDVRGKDYHKYRKGLVCRLCQSKADKKQLIKWISIKG